MAGVEPAAQVIFLYIFQNFIPFPYHLTDYLPTKRTLTKISVIQKQDVQ